MKMIKKYISGENLIYVLSLFEKQITQIMEERINIVDAVYEDIELIFKSRK